MARPANPLTRPTQDDLRAVEVQVARAETRNAIHTTGTCLACMRGLIKAPYWGQSEQDNWNYYKRSIDHALANQTKPREATQSNR